MTITIAGIDHVVLRVRDIDTSLKFYCGVLGCREERRIDKIGLIQLRAGRSLIDLVDVAGELGKNGGKPPGEEGRNLDHFALRIEPFEEVVIRGWLADHGIEVGDVKERYGAEGSGPSFYIEDPDGNVIELKGPSRDAPSS